MLIQLYNHEMSIRPSDVRHKYSCAMAEYLDYCGMADEWTGGGDTPYDSVSLHGKRLLFTDGRGFVSVDKYASAENARVVFDAIQDACYQYEWACDEGTDEDIDAVLVINDYNIRQAILNNS